MLIGNAGQQNRLWINDGTGRFWNATTQVPTILTDTQAVGATAWSP